MSSAFPNIPFKSEKTAVKNCPRRIAVGSLDKQGGCEVQKLPSKQRFARIDTLVG
jgi:hypothetical protein